MRKKFNTKKFGIGLLAAFTAITAGLTISSKVLNDKVQESISNSVERSTKAIISTDEEGFEETLASSEVAYTKIGNNTYIVEYNSYEKAQDACDIYSKDSNISINEDTPFAVASFGEVSSSASVYKLDTVPEGMTLREYADSVGKKIVAVIDTGVSSDYATASKNFTTDDDEDKNGHGTGIAKTILDNSNDQAIILSLKAINDTGYGYASNIIEAIQYAKEQQVDVINMSFVTDAEEGKETFINSVKSAIDSGITVVAAAGNYASDTKAYYPAGIDGVISVGAMDGTGTKTATSNYNATYYEEATSTSYAAAIYSGRYVSDNIDTSNDISSDTIKINDEDKAEENHKIFEKDENGEYIVQSTSQNISGSTGGKGTMSLQNQLDGGIVSGEYPSIGGASFNYGGNVGVNITASAYNGYHLDSISVSGSNGNYAGTFQCDGTYYTNSIQVVPASSTSVTANYSNTTVNVNLNGGSGTSGTKTSTGRDSTINLGTPTRAGHIFTGWSVTGGNGWMDGTTYHYGTEHGSVQANWRAATYTITFDGNGGTSSSAQTNPENNFSLNLPNSTRTYYNFLGWGSSKNNNPDIGKNKTYYFGEGNKTVYGAWQGKLVYIAYNGNGTSVTNVPNTQSTRYGTYINLTNQVPVRAGYTFKNWNTSASASAGQSDTSHILYNPGQSTYMAMSWDNIIHDNDGKTVTLYAIWSENSYSVSYNLNKPGTTTPSGDTSGQTYKYTQSFNVHSAPSCTGYIFQGWNTAKDGSGKSFSANQAVSFQNNLGANNVTLYAQWKAIEYDVIYDANGGQNVRYNSSTKADQKVTYSSDVEQKVSSAPAQSHHVYDAYKNLSTSSTFTWSGHTLLGWSTNPNATTATYTNGQSIRNLTTTNGGKVTLYAVWKANSYTLSINPNNGGTWGGTKSTQKGNADTYQDGKGNTKWGDAVTIGDAVADNKTATITYNVNAGDDADTVVIDKTSDTVKWMFSRWTTSGVSRYLHNNSARANDGSHDNGGTTYFVVHDSNDTITANYYWQTVTLPTPTREGYTFLGWYYDSNCTDKVDGRGAGNTKYPLDANGVERESEFRTTGNGGATFRTEGDVTLYARWQKNSYDYADTLQVFVQDNDNASTGVYFRKVDSITMLPITNDSAIIGIYKGSISDSNLVLKIDTKNGLYNASGSKVADETSDADGWYNITGYLTNGTTYIAHEIQPPIGYLYADDIKFTYNNAKRTQIQMEDPNLSELLPEGMDLNKIDAYNRGISGAKYTLTDTTTGKTIGTFISDKQGVIIYDLPNYVTAGHRYCIHEVEAPEGFELANDVYFTVAKSSNEEIVIPSVIEEQTSNASKLKIKKIDNDSNPLEGAVFQLFMKDADGELIPCYMDKTTGEWVNATEESDTVTIMTAATGADGIATFNNLPKRANYTGSEEDYTKSYYLKEIQAPEGKTLLTEIMEIRLPDDNNTEFTYTVTDESITLTLEAGGNGTLVYTGAGSVILITCTILACALKKRKHCLEN